MKETPKADRLDASVLFIWITLFFLFLSLKSSKAQKLGAPHPQSKYQITQDMSPHIPTTRVPFLQVQYHDLILIAYYIHKEYFLDEISKGWWTLHEHRDIWFRTKWGTISNGEWKVYQDTYYMVYTRN